MFELRVVRLETLNIGALQRAIKIGAVYFVHNPKMAYIDRMCLLPLCYKIFD